MPETINFYFIINDTKMEIDNSPDYILKSTIRVSLDLPKVNIRVNQENEKLRTEKEMGFFKKLFYDPELFFNTSKRWRIYEIGSDMTKVDYEMPVYVHKETLRLTQDKPTENEMNQYINFQLIRWYHEGLL
jgi:hypothetical protein